MLARLLGPVLVLLGAGALLLWSLAVVPVQSLWLPAMVSIGFLSFMLFTSNPFARNLPNPPPDGADLNPLLQDFGLIIHPPMLYMGYVGFAVPFAFAIAAMLGGRLDAAWARWSRPCGRPRISTGTSPTRGSNCSETACASAWAGRNRRSGT